MEPRRKLFMDSLTHAHMLPNDVIMCMDLKAALV